MATTLTLENYTVRALDKWPFECLTGRRKIKTPVREITEGNVRDVLSTALAVHALNVGEINYLWDFYRGKQDIRNKEKFVREVINNKVCVNRANEIVTFKTAYLLNEDVQYVCNGGEDSTVNDIIRLNEYMRAEDKASKDKEIIDWVHICGVAPRLVLTDAMANKDYGAPYYIYTLDPREAFVIYSSRIGENPMAGVVIQKDENEQYYATIYTENRVFTVTKDTVSSDGHTLGGIPLVEYINNVARMGAFEAVVPILNAINQLESDAVDSVQDFVNGFDVFQNCDIADGSYQQLGIGNKAVKIKTVEPGMEAKVYRVASEISQSGVQSRIDDLTDAYITICGMPNRNGGSSTSDTGTAVIFRDGFFEAESRAKDTEKLFKRSEREFLRIVLNICSVKGGLNLDLKDIEINFARKNLNNLQSRFQCLSEGLANDWIHPKLVYDAFGDIFGDKTAAYRLSSEWHEKTKQEEAEALDKELSSERDRINAANKGEE